MTKIQSFSILQYHAPPSWIEGRTKTRLDGHPGRHACLANMAEGGFSAAWSKSLRNVPFFDASFIETWLETDGEVPKKVVTRGYSNFCEGYIFDVEGKSFLSVSNLTATLVWFHATHASLSILDGAFFSFIARFAIRNLLCKISSVLNFHIRTLLSVKTQDTQVIVRARSYKSQRKNEEPWRLQVSLFIILKFCLSSNFAWCNFHTS